MPSSGAAAGRWSRRASRRRRIAQELSSRITRPRARVIFRIYGWTRGQIRTRAYELVLRRVTYRDAYTLCVHRFPDGTALNHVTYPATNARHLQILHDDLCNAAWKQPIDRPVFSRSDSSDASKFNAHCATSQRGKNDSSTRIPGCVCDCTRDNARR